MSVWIERRPKSWLIIEQVGRNGDRTYYTEKTHEAAKLTKRRLLSARAVLKTLAPGSPLPWDELIDRWAVDKKGFIEDTTITEVRRRVERAVKQNGWKTTLDVRKSHINDMRKGKGARPVAYILSMLRWAHAELAAGVDLTAIGKYKGKVASDRPDQEDTPLLNDVDFAAIQAKADGKSKNIGALVHYLERYGARPITAAKLDVGDFIPERRGLLIRVKQGKKPKFHPLFADTLKRFEEIVKDRKPGDPLFTNSHGRRWLIRGDKGAHGFVKWYPVALGSLAPEGLGGTKQLKRRAISRMLAGDPPWTKALTVKDVMLFTHHRTASQVLRYARTNQERALSLVGTNGNGVETGAITVASITAPALKKQRLRKK